MRLWIGLAISWALLALVLFYLPMPGHAQETRPHPDMSKPGAKDPYTENYNWDGEWCCNGHDCEQALHPQDFKPIEKGYLVVPTGEVVPMGKTGISKDGQWHICRFPAKVGPVRCLLVPNGGV